MGTDIAQEPSRIVRPGRHARLVSLNCLAAVKQSQPKVVHTMLRAGAPIDDILATITELNLELHREVFERAVATTRVGGIDVPPVAVTLLVMGSAGRGESFLYPDQDNGLILGDYDDQDHVRFDPYFIALAERLNDDLAHVGFPLCNGQVMARNPVWRKTARQWHDQIARWTQRRDPVAARFGDAFLDFQAVCGPMEPAARLRAQLDTAFRTNAALVTELCRDSSRRTVAVGWFGHLLTEDCGERGRRVDLKTHGTVPLVAAVRLWALARSVSYTGTRARLRALGELGVVGASDVTALGDAFAFLARLILLQQIKDARVGRAMSCLIDPEDLPSDERDHLVAALRRIAAFDAETRAVFAGELY